MFRSSRRSVLSFGSSSNPAVATIAAQVEGSYDPTLGPSSWSNLGAAIDVNTVGGSGSGTSSLTTLPRYIRARLSIPAATYSTVSLQGVAHDAT